MSSFILCGGSPPLKNGLTKRVSEKVGKDARMLVLALHREGWESYIEKVYIDPFKKEGIINFDTILGDKVDEQRIIEGIRQADLLIISGGDTPHYQEVYCRENIRQIVQEKVETGMVIIGFSAGAIIMGDKIAISPKDNTQGISLFRQGLGVYDDFLIGVHHNTWKDEEHLLEAKKKTGYKKVYGIDEESYIVMDDKQELQFIGGVHDI